MDRSPHSMAEDAEQHEASGSGFEFDADLQLRRWGAAAGLAGVVSLVGAVAVVIAMDLPDASDPETLIDFADIKSGRIAEHFFYLGAVVLFMLHVSVLRQVLGAGHAAAALFGGVVAGVGYVIMAASSLLHLSTSPLADLYTDAATPAEDQQMIEYAWHGAQSVFDTMLVTGVLLVPIGIGLLGVAMRTTPGFGIRFAVVSIVLGIAGTLGAATEVVFPESDASAAAVLIIAVFHLVVGWRTIENAT